jgi:hypothetical protein
VDYTDFDELKSLLAEVPDLVLEVVSIPSDLRSAEFPGRVVHRASCLNSAEGAVLAGRRFLLLLATIFFLSPAQDYASPSRDLSCVSIALMS